MPDSVVLHKYVSFMNYKNYNEINLESLNLKRALKTLCSSASKQLFAQAEDDLIRTQCAPGKTQPSLLKM